MERCLNQLLEIGCTLVASLGADAYGVREEGLAAFAASAAAIVEARPATRAAAALVLARMAAMTPMASVVGMQPHLEAIRLA